MYFLLKYADFEQSKKNTCWLKLLKFSTPVYNMLFSCVIIINILCKIVKPTALTQHFQHNFKVLRKISVVSESSTNPNFLKILIEVFNLNVSDLPMFTSTIVRSEPISEKNSLEILRKLLSSPNFLKTFALNNQRKLRHLIWIERAQ